MSEFDLSKEIERIGDYLEEKFGLAPTQHAILVESLYNLVEKQHKQFEEAVRLIQRAVEEQMINGMGNKKILPELDIIMGKINKIVVEKLSK